MQLPPQLTTTSQGEQAGLGRPLFVRLSELELPMVMLRTQYRVCAPARHHAVWRSSLIRMSICLSVLVRLSRVVPSVDVHVCQRSVLWWSVAERSPRVTHAAPHRSPADLRTRTAAETASPRKLIQWWFCVSVGVFVSVGIVRYCGGQGAGHLERQLLQRG